MNKFTRETAIPPIAATCAVTIIIAAQASGVEKYAAEELHKYLSIIYGINAVVQSKGAPKADGSTIVIGHPRNHRGFADMDWPELSADSFCLKTVSCDPDVLVVAGGSGRGTLFGVYELIERWGVRFLLSGHVLPEQPEPFRLYGFDECIEPAYQVRAMRPFPNLPEGSAPWSLAEYTNFIDQMAKLKFNAYVFAIMESGPWLDYEFRGMKRPAGDIFYGYRFPIDDEFIGRELFVGQSEFYNSHLAKAANEEERKQIGIDLVRSIIEHCKSRGLMTILTFSMLEPPTALKHACNEWTNLPLPDPKCFEGAHFTVTPAEEFGINPQYAAWMNVQDPVVKELTSHRLKSLINTYPNADFYHLWVSEHRAAVVDCDEPLKALDAKYHLFPEFDWEKILEGFASSPFDRERYQNQIKGDLTFLFAIDAILNEEELLKHTVKPDAAISIAGVMPQLAPIVTKILPEGSALGQFLDYGSHGTADQIDRMVPLLNAGVPSVLEIGIHDDNNMYFPQANVESVERIIKTTGDGDMLGYVVALWQVRQSDISAVYLARASWHPETTASDFYQDFLPKLVGISAATDFEQAYRIIEDADHQVRKGLYGYAFLFTDNLLHTFIHQGVKEDEICNLRAQFQVALGLLREARRKASTNGVAYVEFWIKRTQFAIEWLDMAIACADLGKILGEGLKPGASLKAEQKQSAIAALDGLLARSRSLIELIIGDAKHMGDLGQIANMNRFAHHYLADMLKDISQRALLNG